jgi:ATP adenylyltransferase
MDSGRTDRNLEPNERLLWAPWRIEYIRGIRDDECFLCGKAQGEGAADEDDLVVARGVESFLVMNAYPYNSGHILVAPYRHVADLSDLSESEIDEIMKLILHAKKLLVRLMRPDGFNFGFNLGAAAGAGVKSHVHGHLVPRWVGDTNFMPVIDNTRVVPEALAETARVLRQAWQKDPL